MQNMDKKPEKEPKIDLTRYIQQYDKDNRKIKILRAVSDLIEDDDPK